MHAVILTRMSRLFIACTLLASAGSGCLLMFPGSPDTMARHALLQPIVGPRDAIDLEVYFVDRRIGDPLIGEALWSSLYAISSVTPEVRQQLMEDGFRFAMSPSRPPRALQSLLKLSNEQDPSRRVVPRRYTVPSGQETLLMVSTVPDGTPLQTKTPEGIKTTELTQGQCLLRVHAQRMDDGWTKLLIIPEIRHGATALRPVATNQDWEFREGQISVPFYNDRLSAEVNIGEMVVLGLDPNLPDALASRFFRSDISQGTERLLLIRVANMRKVEAVRATGE